MSELQVRTRANRQITLPEDALRKLKESLRGELILSGDNGYDDARSIWNAMIDRRPALIARCSGVADVVASVNFAREHALIFSVKGGGHNIAGLAVCEGGLVLDMSRMRGVWVDASKRTALAQAGCLLGDVDRETQVHGLAAVLGFISNTGIAGLTLGGGFGYLTRRFGWTSDNLASLEVVTANGRVVRATEAENSDLFWALRGGGGNFGVVTTFEYKVYPVGPEVVAGGIAWPAKAAGEILEMLRKLMEEAPPELVCVAALRIAPPAPWLSKDIHGKPIVALFVCHTGEVSKGEKLVEPIKSFGSPVGDIIQRRPYVSQQNLLDATQPKGRRYYWKSEYLPRLQPELLGQVMRHAQKIRSPHSAILLFPVDGQLNRMAEDHSAAGNRDSAWVLNIAASWEKAEDDNTNVEWARAAWRDMRSFSTGGTYVNFLTEEEGDERIRAAYGNNYQKLAEIKSKWDPDNLFCMNKNIPPNS
ncbi:MAG TPA: FAD-binding oxidoreductase [Candidatus Binatia bacterium]|nr:FAD-binding oxidoreductase [Candidatus Binatia bacterium]